VVEEPPVEPAYEEFADSLQSRADEAFVGWVEGLQGEELLLVLRAAAVPEAEIAHWHSLSVSRRGRLLRGQLAGGELHCDVGHAADVAVTAWEPAGVMGEETDDWTHVLMDELGISEEQALLAVQWDEDRREAVVREHEQRILEAVMCRLTAASSPRIAAVALAFALSVPLVRVATSMDGRRVLRECRTQMQAAAALLTSRQNLSKEVRKALRFLGAKQNMHSKRPHEVESFRSAQRRDHWRRRVFARGCEHGRRIG
jgi:hypothetical protein